MRIVMLEPLGIPEEQVMNLAKPLKEMGHEFESCTRKTDDEMETAERVRNADILIIANSPLSGDVIRMAPKLRMISVAFTGVDHVDLNACREKNIRVCNAQGYATKAVAELTLALILNVLRNIITCHERTRTGGTKEGLVGHELFGKTIGIIGTGAIGRCVAELAKAFGCKVLGYSRSENEEAKNIGVQYVFMEKLLSESDIVSLHTPLTDETRLLINEDRIALMKHGAILINTARGAVVDSHALARALNDGRLAGAGIDVFEMEPPIPADHPLTTARNVVLTPHVAFATKESMLRRAEITFNNITAWLNGTPQNVKL